MIRSETTAAKQFQMQHSKVQVLEVEIDAVTKKKASSRGETAVRSQTFSSASEMFPPPGDQTSLGGLWGENPFLCPFSIFWQKKKELFKKGEKNPLSETSMAETK